MATETQVADVDRASDAPRGDGSGAGFGAGAGAGAGAFGRPEAADGHRFVPPTAEEFAEHLDANDLRTPSVAAMWMPLLVVLVIAAAGWAAGGVAALALPWGALMGLLVWSARRAAAWQRRMRETRRCAELAGRRYFPAALQRAWRLLPEVREQPSLHGELVSVMTHALAALRQYEAAGKGYRFMLERMGGTGNNGAVGGAPDVGVARLRLLAAVTALLNEDLYEGDELIRKARGTASQYPDSPLFALLRTAELFQAVRTHHFEDGTAMAGPTLMDELRPLGFDAGFGYAAAALCWHQRGDTGRATAWWRSATLLVPDQALIHRLPGTEALRGR